jgi:hypothetical protein
VERARARHAALPEGNVAAVCSLAVVARAASAQLHHCELKLRERARGPRHVGYGHGRLVEQRCREQLARDDEDDDHHLLVGVESLLVLVLYLVRREEEAHELVLRQDVPPLPAQEDDDGARRARALRRALAMVVDEALVRLPARELGAHKD